MTTPEARAERRGLGVVRSRVMAAVTAAITARSMTPAASSTAVGAAQQTAH